MIKLEKDIHYGHLYFLLYSNAYKQKNLIKLCYFSKRCL